MQNIENIFNEFYSPLCNYATKILNNSSFAEDVVQELFVQLWQNNKLKDIQSPEKFLLRSVKFKCIDFLRKNKNEFAELDNNINNTKTTETLMLNEEDVEPLLHYFASKLPKKTKEVFLLSRTSKLTYSQIADELDIAVKTVETHMSKALKTMRLLLKEHNFYSALLIIEMSRLIEQ